MQQVSTLELMGRAVRQVICARCFKRPHRSELFGPRDPRPCETECTIFANLAKLAKIAHDDAGDRRAPIEKQVEEQICINCHAHASVGAECERRASRECPLSVYMLDVLEPLERLLAARSRRRAKSAGYLQI